jgi:hypothetical protein
MRYSKDDSVEHVLNKVDGEWRDDEDKNFDAKTDALLDDLFPDANEDTSVNVVIEYSVEGWWTSGSEPPDGDQDISINYVTVDGDGDSKKIAELEILLESAYEDEINELDINPEDCLGEER